MKSDTPDAMPEMMLDKMTGILEGPLNSVLERVMRSRLVTVPASLTLTLALKGYTRVAGKLHAGSSARATDPHRKPKKESRR